jgi:hypothetical protein
VSDHERPGPMPAEVLEELARVRASLDETVPAKWLDRNLLIATWNLRAFGDLTLSWQAGPSESPKRDLRALNVIAEIVSRFDVIAIQEVKGNIRALRHLLKALGPSWGFILTDVTRGTSGNNERLAFVFDSRRVQTSGLAGELVVPLDRPVPAGALDRQFARTPYAVSFRAGPQTFTLVTLHVLWGARAPEPPRRPAPVEPHERTHVRRCVTAARCTWRRRRPRHHQRPLPAPSRRSPT